VAGVLISTTGQSKLQSIVWKQFKNEDKRNHSCTLLGAGSLKTFMTVRWLLPYAHVWSAALTMEIKTGIPINLRHHQLLIPPDEKKECAHCDPSQDHSQSTYQ
jgi:hypothetical protein